MALMGEVLTYLPPYDGWENEEPQMRFRLYYDGELRSGRKVDNSGNDVVQLSKHKQEIRKNFHKQLKMLWETNAFLNSHVIHRTDGTSGRSAASDAAQYDAMGFDPLQYQSGRQLFLVDAIANQYVENGYRFVC